MRAMMMTEPGKPLQAVELAKPVPGPHQLLIKVEACGVCRTDLHIMDGELSHPKQRLIPGHEIIGRVEAIGEAVGGFHIGGRVGVGWLGRSCEHCNYCDAGQENLCEEAQFTGYSLDGGYAEYVLAEGLFCLPMNPSGDAALQAPLLCAGAIGYRCLHLTGEAQRVGIYGFGAAGHLVAQFARAEGREAYAFVRPGDETAKRLAIDLGCAWAGDSNERPPVALDAAIIFAPVGALVPLALAAIRKAGTVVCGGIHMSAIPEFDYGLLWGERVIRSVANVRRKDLLDCLAAAHRHKLDIKVQRFPLAKANDALAALRDGKILGAAVLIP